MYSHSKNALLEATPHESLTPRATGCVEVPHTAAANSGFSASSCLPKRRYVAAQNQGTSTRRAGRSAMCLGRPVGPVRARRESHSRPSEPWTSATAMKATANTTLTITHGRFTHRPPPPMTETSPPTSNALEHRKSYLRSYLSVSRLRSISRDWAGRQNPVLPRNFGTKRTCRDLLGHVVFSLSRSQVRVLPGALFGDV